MDKKNRWAAIIILIACLIVALYFFTRPKGQVTVDSGYRPVMGTFARTVAIAANSEDANRCIEAGFEQLRNIDNLMSTYKDDSEISEINREGFKRAVKVSESTFEVLQKALQFSELSDGAFDITIGPLMNLWRSAGQINSVPSDNELAEAHSRVGWEKLILDGNDMSVRFAAPAMKLDLGGIAKGYAIDKAVEAMQRAGAIGAMVDIGGDIRCFGEPLRGKEYWLIGLQDPTEISDDIVIPAQLVLSEVEGAGIQTGEPLLVLQLTNAAVATSGDYQRFVLIGGKKYSHIIEPLTGSGAKGLSSVTIICNNAIDADALATAVTVMGAEKGLALIETIPQTEAILIPAGSSELIKSSGAEKYIK